MGLVRGDLEVFLALRASMISLGKVVKGKLELEIPLETFLKSLRNFLAVNKDVGEVGVLKPR